MYNIFYWASIRGHTDVVKLLLEAGMRHEGALYVASYFRHTEIVKLLEQYK